MRKRILVSRAILAIAVLFAVVVIVNVVIVSRELRLDMRKSDNGITPPAVQLHSGDLRGARVVFDARSQNFCEPFQDSNDTDQDGLTARAEYLQQTSDNDPDTDGDGINDKEDMSPNGVVDTFKGNVLSLVVSSHLEQVRPQPKEGHIYIQTQSWERGERVSVDYAGAKTINIHQLGFLYLPDYANLDWNLLRTHEVVFVPGLFYAYESYLYCGPDCADHKLYFLLHIPFTGPVIIGSI